MSVNLTQLLYLVAGVLFILALRGLSSPASSRQGNRFGMIGMAIAVLTTLALRPPSSGFAWLLVILGFAIGGGELIGIGLRGAGRLLGGVRRRFQLGDCLIEIFHLALFRVRREVKLTSVSPRRQSKFERQF